MSLNTQIFLIWTGPSLTSWRKSRKSIRTLLVPLPLLTSRLIKTTIVLWPIFHQMRMDSFAKDNTTIQPLSASYYPHSDPPFMLTIENIPIYSTQFKDIWRKTVTPTHRLSDLWREHLFNVQKGIISVDVPLCSQIYDWQTGDGTNPAADAPNRTKKQTTLFTAPHLQWLGTVWFWTEYTTGFTVLSRLGRAPSNQDLNSPLPLPRNRSLDGGCSYVVITGHHSYSSGVLLRAWLTEITIMMGY